MKRALVFSTLVISLALAGACNQTETAGVAGEQTRATSAENLTPEDLGKLGAELKKSPDRAEEILSEHGLDQQTFETEIRKVTEDPEASKRYAAAYKQANGEAS
jgi:hypothetical protein